MEYDQFERADADDTADTFGLSPGVAAVQMERKADVFCRTCARDMLGEEAFDRLKEENLGHDHELAGEFGNVTVVLSSEEWDCPGANCGHCGVPLDVKDIHYEEVCQLDTCPLSTECEVCGDGIYPDDPACKTTAGITCRDCAKKGGVDVGAFCMPVRRLLN